jgi:sugar phosphate isomerase/epimerase
MKIGVNLEFVREHDMSFREGIETASEIGYDYVEPCVSPGYDLLAEAGYYHMVSLEEDPLEYREMTDELGLTVEGVSSHAPLMKPEASVNWLRRAIEWTDAWGGEVVNTDEGPRPALVDDDEFAIEVMRYTLRTVTRAAERHDVTVGIEPHQAYTSDAETFSRLLNLVDSPNLGINYDTGNAYLQGNDPVGYLEALGPEQVVHLHAKDISVEQSDEERGEVTGTPVGCAVGEGLVEWSEVFAVLEGAGFDGVVSVECGGIEEAESSYDYLTELADELDLGATAVADD